MQQPGTASSKVGGVKVFCRCPSKNNAKLALTVAPPFSKKKNLKKLIGKTCAVTRLL